MTEIQARRVRYFDKAGLALTLLTMVCAVIWAFPLYWSAVTTLKPEQEVVRPYVELWPDTFTLEAYVHVITQTNMGIWYLNSLVTSAAVTLGVILMGVMAGYAISQLRFPGRRLLWWMILASFMVPIPALIVNHYILMADAGFLDSWAGIVVPQLIHPVVVIVYKQFFDSVPPEYREAAVIDGASHFQMLFRIFLPMNWGVTTALAVITFIGAWNAFLWPFLAVNHEDQMTITVGITQVNDAFGVYYARDLAAAVMAALPVAIIYLIFQRRVTQAITLSAGIKG
ncbi:MAG: carbohydrate ABC transporter permease [Alphaproteobacteria bacterium]